MRSKILKYSGVILPIVFFSGIFIFFAFFYSSHFHFEEQKRLFLLTGDYLIEKLRYPGGFSGYIGGFLTQLYYLPLAGPALVTLLLWALQVLFRKVLKKVNPEDSWFPLSYLPSLNCAMILCDEFYPLSGIIGLLVAIIFIIFYFNIRSTKARFSYGLLIIVLTYWMAGGSFITFIASAVVFEFYKARSSGKSADKTALKLWQVLLFPVTGLVIPLLVRKFFIMQPLGLAYISEFYYDLRSNFPLAIRILLILPSVVILIVSYLPSSLKTGRLLVIQLALMPIIIFFGFRLWANFGAERIMNYDYLVRSERWNDVIELAYRHPPRNNLSLAMLNLALAHTGKMGDLMFHFGQNGDGGLFLPFTREYVAPMMGSEILFQLGLVNASQEYSFESMETIPDFSKSPRCLKRLAETNLINGQYEVAARYLRLLRKTIFYRKWADDTWSYLNNEEKINNHPVWGEKRRMMIKKDFFFKIQNIESTLNMLLRENPKNRIAFDYLMAFYLIHKDLRNFMNNTQAIPSMGYKKIPEAYEEAMMYVVGLSTNNPLSAAPVGISDATKARMKAYADIYTTNPNAKKALEKKFSGTYWYYLHFYPMKNN